jgi:hypothetical protein
MAPKSILLLPEVVLKLPAAAAVLGPTDAAVFGVPASDPTAVVLESDADTGDPVPALARPHTLACLSILESEKVREHSGHSALMLTGQD